MTTELDNGSLPPQLVADGCTILFAYGGSVQFLYSTRFSMLKERPTGKRFLEFTSWSLRLLSFVTARLAGLLRCMRYQVTIQTRVTPMIEQPTAIPMAPPVGRPGEPFSLVAVVVAPAVVLEVP